MSSVNEVERVQFMDMSQLDNHPSMRYGHTMCYVGTEVFIFGGFDGENCSNSMVVFNAQNDQWEREFYIDDDISERYYHACCVVGGMIFIHGGRITEGGKVLNDIISFDPSIKRFLKVETENDPPFLYGHKMFGLGDNLVYFIGGKDEKSRYSRSLYYFNTRTKTFEEAEIESLEDIPLTLVCHHQILAEDSADMTTLYVFQGETPNPEEEEGEMEEDRNILRTGVITRITLDPDCEDIAILEETKSKNPNKPIFIRSLFHVQDMLNNHIYCVGCPKSDTPDSVMNVYRLQEEGLVESDDDAKYEWSRRNILNLSDFRPYFRPNHTLLHLRGKVYVFGGQILVAEKDNRKRKTVRTGLMETDFDEFVLGDNLALDIVVEISRFLTSQDILNLCHVAKEWGVSQNSRNDLVWRRFYQSEEMRCLGTSKNLPLREDLRKIDEDPSIKHKLYEKFILLKRRTHLWGIAELCYIPNPEDVHRINFQKLEEEYRSFVRNRISPLNVSCCIVGDKGVGKRSLIERLKRGTNFDPEYYGSIGDLEHYGIRIGGVVVSVNFKDNTGFEGYDRLIELTYKSFRVFLVAFDMTSRKTFENVEKRWMQDITKYRDTTLTPEVILIGTKRDLYYLRRRNEEEEEDEDLNTSFVSTEEAIEYARRRPEISFYLETSSHDDMNVSRGKVFGKLVCAAHIFGLYKSLISLGKRKSKKVIDDDCKIL